MSALGEGIAIGTTQPETVKSDKPKREKKTELAPGVALGSALYNKLFNVLSAECQCRPNICPSTLAQLAAAWEAEIAIVVGENNPEYNKKIFDSHRDTIGEISLQKIKSQPLRTTAQVFGYETLRPKRERSADDDTGANVKRSRKTATADKAPDSDHASDSECLANANFLVDAEGNRVNSQ